MLIWKEKAHKASILDIKLQATKNYWGLGNSFFQVRVPQWIYPMPKDQSWKHKCTSNTMQTLFMYLIICIYLYVVYLLISISISLSIYIHININKKVMNLNYTRRKLWIWRRTVEIFLWGFGRKEKEEENDIASKI